MLLRFMAAVILVWIAIVMLPEPKTQAKPTALITAHPVEVSGETGGERRETYYPGTCPDNASWYLVDSDSTSVTVGCYDPDYEVPQ